MSPERSRADHPLAAQILADAQQIVEDALGYMPQDAFWQDRYPERGRRFAVEDGHYHLKYLAEALVAASPATFERYAAWLQGVLNTRGMCTRHLDRHFESLARVLEVRVADGAEAAVRVLESGRAALLHRDAEAAAVQRSADVVGRTVAWPREVEYSSAWDAAYLTVYLADGLALATGDHFVAHARWTAGILEARGVARQRLAGQLRDIQRALSDEGVSSGRTDRSIAEAIQAVERWRPDPQQGHR